MRRCLFLLMLLFVSVALVPQPRTRAAEQPNILFLLADDQRPDTIKALGNDRISTPNLDDLVRRGLTFRRATCSYPICWVSRGEMITGRHGWETGITARGSGKITGPVAFWPETLRRAGYDTWMVGKWHISGRLPADCGFTGTNGFYMGGGKPPAMPQTDWKGFPITGYRGWIFQSGDRKQKHPEKGVGLTPDISSLFADAAIEVIEKKSEKPWFLWVNFTAPHDPLLMPPNYEGRYKTDEMEVPGNFLPQHPFDHGNLKGRDETLMHFPRTKEAVQDVLRVYYSVIDDLDQQIGRILAALDKTHQRKNTLIIYSSDHGMAVGSHGLRGKQNMYEHTINTPLIISGPGIPQGAATDAQVYLRELYPTTCDLAGVPIPQEVTAASFIDVLTGKSKQQHDQIYGYFTDSQRMVRNDRWKLIRYPQADRWQLFDLQNDPLEMNNLADKAKHREVFTHLREELATWRKKTGDPLKAE